MFFNDDEKEGKREALEKLKAMMMGEMGDRLGRLKKPVAASMTIEKEPDEGDEPDGDEGMEGDEDDMGDKGDISDEDKARIKELYHKYC